VHRLVQVESWHVRMHFSGECRERKLLHSGFGLIEGVVGRSNERARFNMLETHPLAQNPIFRKFIRVDVANYREMFARRLKVLAQGEDVSALCGQFLHRGENFVFFFTETQHEPSLGGDVGVGLLRAMKQFK